MNANPGKLLSTSAAIMLLALGSAPARAAADCAVPKSTAERRACEAASQGVPTLRRFVERTQSIYGLYIQDFRDAVAKTDVAKREEPKRTASAK
jgi:hypothetical protein